MNPDDAAVFVVFLIVATIAIPWLIFALAVLFAGFPRLRLQQILGLVGVAAWVFAYIASIGPSGGTALLVIGTTVAILLAFAGMWSHEFRMLMLRRSDEFPDRSDKLAWVAVLTLIAPAGVWLFRSYRKDRWPEAVEAARPHPLDSPDPSGEMAGFGESSGHRFGA